MTSLVTWFQDLRDGAGEARRQHPKTWLFGRLIAASLFTLWFVLLHVDLVTWKPWIEILNGATWPDDRRKVLADSPVLFPGAIALRTTINLAGVVSVIAAVAWFFFGGLERYMNIHRIELLKLFNAELVGSFVSTLQSKGHLISVEEEQALLVDADRMAEAFVKDLKKAADGNAQVEG